MTNLKEFVGRVKRYSQDPDYPHHEFAEKLAQYDKLVGELVAALDAALFRTGEMSDKYNAYDSLYFDVEQSIKAAQAFGYGHE